MQNWRPQVECAGDLQQGVKWIDCKRRNKWSCLSPETGGGTHSDQTEHGRKGFGSRWLTCCSNGIELTATFPSRQVSWRWRPLAGNKRGRGVWGVKEVGKAWAAPRRQVEQHLDCTLTPCSAWYCCCASGHFQKQTCRHYNSTPKLRPYTAISTCKRGEQHAEQMKVLSHHGTHSSPCFTSFGPLIWPWGCSVQPMLCARLFAAQRSSYCTDCDTVNKSFSLRLPGKNWACIALLNKKGLSTNNWKLNIVVLVSWVIK